MMATNAQNRTVLRFNGFEVDPRSREVRKNGSRFRLQDQPLEVLLLLVERKGEVVAREELKEKLWPAGTFVDADDGLNTAIRKLREVLHDSIERPRYIETIPRRGYRFIGKLEAEEAEPAERRVEAFDGLVPPSEPSADAETKGSSARSGFAAGIDAADPQPPNTSTTAVTTIPSTALREARWFRRNGLLIAAVLAVGLATAMWFSRRPLPPLRVTEYTQITHDGNYKYVLGADASRIYLILSGQRLAQMSLTGGQFGQIPVDFNPPPAFWDVSPDGASILISSRDGGLWSFDFAGLTSRHLGQPDAINATWSPDGKRIAYTNTESQMFVMKSDGTDVRLIYTPASVTWESLGDTDLLDWSPDGRRIRFTEAHSLWEISPDGSNLRRLLPNWRPSSWKCCGRWTHDGNFYVFLAGETLMRSWQLGAQAWAIDERRGLFRSRDPEPFPLTSGPSRWGTLTPSRDGKKIFAQGVSLRGELDRYDSQSKELKPYLNGISAEFLTYSPDGKSLAYVTFPEGILWRANLDGTGLVQLSEPPIYPKRALWSPDGTQIMFLDSNPTGKHSIYMVSSRGGPVERVFPDDDGEEDEANWSPDGRKILFAWCSCKTNKWDGELRTEDISTHQVTTIPESSGILWSIRWSPDGRYVEARRDGNSMVVYDFASRKWAKILDGPSDWPSWSNDSRFIYFFAWPSEAAYRIPVTGGTPEKIVDLHDVKQTGWAGSWMGLDPTDTPMLLRDVGTDDIYALTLEQK